jgi:hypothetical protein
MWHLSSLFLQPFGVKSNGMVVTIGFKEEECIGYEFVKEGAGNESGVALRECRLVVARRYYFHRESRMAVITAIAKWVVGYSEWWMH